MVVWNFFAFFLFIFVSIYSLKTETEKSTICQNKFLFLQINWYSSFEKHLNSFLCVYFTTLNVNTPSNESSSHPEVGMMLCTGKSVLRMEQDRHFRISPSAVDPDGQWRLRLFVNLHFNGKRRLPGDRGYGVESPLLLKLVSISERLIKCPNKHTILKQTDILKR